MVDMDSSTNTAACNRWAQKSFHEKNCLQASRVNDRCINVIIAEKVHWLWEEQILEPHRVSFKSSFSLLCLEHDACIFAIRTKFINKATNEVGCLWEEQV